MYTRYAKLRDSKGLTDNAVAVATGIPQSTIYDWKQRSAEKKTARLSVENTAKIAKLFDVPIETLLEDE